MIRLNEPTEMDVGHAIKRLCAIHSRPYKVDMDAKLAEWHGGLKCFARDTIDAAVNRSRDEDKFPELPRFRKICFAIERENAPKDTGRQAADPEIQCPDCDGHITWHSIVVMRTEDNVPFETSKEFISHRDGCPYLPRERRMFALYGWAWPDELDSKAESLADRNIRKAHEWRSRKKLKNAEGHAVEAPRHPASPAAKPLPVIADVLPRAVPTAPVPRETFLPHWDEIPLGDAPPDAVLTR